MGKTILIVGAKSDMAKAIAEQYANTRHDLILAARKHNELADFAKNLEICYDIDVDCIELDIAATDTHQAVYDELDEKPYGVITAVGYLGDQDKAKVDYQEAERIMMTNYVGLVSFLNIVAEDFAKRENGFIVGISSVAGDRGRMSNYHYGSAKAAFTAYLSGLRNRLAHNDVHVMTVKPGFVYTKMTDGIPLPKLITSTPEAVAKDIYKAQRKERNILYTSWYWKWIMLVIRLVPERLFKTLKL